MRLERFGCWWREPQTGVQIASEEHPEGRFTKEQAQQIAHQITGTNLRTSGHYGHKKVTIDGREVYISIMDGVVTKPYIKRTVNGKPVCMYELTSDPLEIIRFQPI